MALGAFEAIIRARIKAPGSKLKGLGIYPTFIHIDVRPSPALVVWYGSRPLAEVPKDT